MLHAQVSKTRLSEVTVEAPQLREGGLLTNELKKGICSEQALLLILAKMYVYGVSPREVAAIIEQLYGTRISDSQVSRATQSVDQELEVWYNIPSGEIVKFKLNARNQRVR